LGTTSEGDRALYKTVICKVFELLLAAGKIQQQTVDEMRCWQHSGFSVDNSVYLPPGDTAALQRLAQYILRCPFSLARVVRLTDDGSVIYRAEQQRCRRFPGPANADLRSGPKSNFQIFSALDFLAEVTQHVPDKGEHLVRGHRPKVGRGWYSNKSRGIRKKAEAEASAESSSEETAATGSSQSWAMLIKRVYEVDPLCCPQCGGQMKVVSFIEPPHVIEAILKHCGVWPSRSARAPPDVDDLVLELDAAYSGSSIESPDQADPSQELTYVDIDTFLERF